ncbi:hypothetical protein [Pseudoalteromonas luteoviolacea]|nr:hypothetical protein [Pseudoalteromonas luteoviolacea]MBQ4879849.1 hypothetical protein [Pseudoalteromonas luteoviolacea]MBQ4908611.1 hypothetical protein [Pseudoalteromonas luteoviolacea]
MNIKRITLALPLILSSTFVDATPVNCRIVDAGTVNLYGGWSYCNAFSSNGRMKQIREYVHPTVLQQRTIHQFINGEWLNCRATVPFSHTEDVTKEVCDYKPGVSVSVRQFSEGSAVFEINEGDRDGTIVSREIRLNGELINTSLGEVQVFGAIGESFYLSVKVTDNDGYTGTGSAGITIKKWGSLNPL